MLSSSLGKPSSNKVIFAPQKGKQEDFLRCSADICLYGGGAGGGKTYGLMLGALRHVGVAGFTGAIFRRNYKQIFDPGGMWSTACEIFPNFGGRVSITRGTWDFPRSGEDRGKLSFHSMKDEKDKFNYQGSQLCLLMFDELTHFTESQWSYMFSRNRSTCGVRPYIRATCNPQDEGFVRRLVDWWIGEDGFPIEERSGVIRYMIRDGDDIHFYDRRDDIPFRHKDDARTFTFIPSKVFDNKILMNKDPAYLSNLKALPLYDRAQLLEGNWNIKREAGMYFRSHWFEVIDRLPVDPSLVSTCRYWDRAATTPTDGTDPDYTAGVKVGRYGDEYFVMDVVRLRETPLKVQDAIKRTSSQDSRRCLVGLEQEGGASGIAECEYLKKALELYNVEIVRAEKSKEWRAKPVSAASEQGRVKILRAPWNKAFLSELQGFPLGSHDDQVDALAGAFNILNRAADY